MLDYDEMTQLVLKMRDEAIEKDRRKKILLKRSAAAALSACAAGAILIINHNSKTPLDPHNGSSAVFPDSTEATETVPEVSTDAAGSPRETAETTAVPAPSKGAAKTTAADIKSVIQTETHASAAPGRKETETSLPANGTAGSIITSSKAGAVVTSAAQSAETAVPVATTIVYDTEISERGFDMKKLATLAASLSILTNVTGFPVSAAEEAAKRNDVTAEDLSIFAELDRGTLDADVNMDGTFDIRDPFELLAYDYGRISDEGKNEIISGRGDLDHDGKVGTNDARVLIKYFIEKDMFRKEQLSAEYYEDYDIVTYSQGAPIYGYLHPELWEQIEAMDLDSEDFDAIEYKELISQADEQGIIGYEKVGTGFSEIFIPRLRSYLNEMGGSQLISNGIKNGMLDFDIDSDGAVYFEDVNIYRLFLNQRFAKERIDKNNAWVYAGMDTDLDPEGRLALLEPELVTPITDEQWAKCEAVYKFCVEDLEITDSDNCAVQYLIERDGKPDDKYFDNSYYESILEGSGAYRPGDTVLYYYGQTLPKSEEAQYDHEEYSRLLCTYCDSVAAGEMTPPDANGDGVLTYKDVIVSVLYENDALHYDVSKERSIVPAEVWDFFESQFDLNDNGVCGEYIDVNLYQMLVMVYIDSINDVEGFCSLSSKEIEEYRQNYINELRMIKDFGAPQEAPMMNGNDVFVGSAVANIAGDANCDGKLDVADAVAVLQFISNAEKYPLSDQGRTNADVDGIDGVTGSDAIAIQKIDAGIE